MLILGKNIKNLLKNRVTENQETLFKSSATKSPPTMILHWPLTFFLKRSNLRPNIFVWRIHSNCENIAFIGWTYAGGERQRQRERKLTQYDWRKKNSAAIKNLYPGSCLKDYVHVWNMQKFGNSVWLWFWFCVTRSEMNNQCFIRIYLEKLPVIVIQRPNFTVQRID